MQLLKPEAGELPAREQKNAQKQPVEPGRALLLFEHASWVGRFHCHSGAHQINRGSASETGCSGIVNLQWPLEIMHALKLLMHGFQLSLNVITLGQTTEWSECKLQMMLGINQKTTVQASRFVAHTHKTRHTIQRQTSINGCANHNNLMCWALLESLIRWFSPSAMRHWIIESLISAGPAMLAGMRQELSEQD